MARNRLFVFLLALLLASMFWSTAMVEILAALFVLSFVVLHARVPVRETNGPGSGHLRLSLLIPLFCWAVYVTCVLLSIFFAGDVASSIPYIGKQWHAILFLVAYQSDVSFRDIRFAASAFVASASVAAVVAIAYYLSGDSRTMHSPFVGDTTFADLLVLAAITCMGLVLTHNKKQRQGEIPGVSKRYMFALGLIAVPIVVAVYLSAMRAPVVALVGGGFVLSMMTGPGAGAAWATVSIGLLAAGPRVLLLKLGWVLAGNPIDRYILWNEGARLLGELPFFGFGPNSFAHILSENALGSFTSRVPTSWHNDFLQTALESGLMAALAYAGCVLGIAHQVFQRAVARGGVYWREFGVLTVLLAAIIFFSLVGSVVSTSILGVLQWTVLGLAANVSRREQ